MERVILERASGGIWGLEALARRRRLAIMIKRKTIAPKAAAAPIPMNTKPVWLGPSVDSITGRFDCCAASLLVTEVGGAVNAGSWIEVEDVEEDDARVTVGESTGIAVVTLDALAAVEVTKVVGWSDELFGADEESVGIATAVEVLEA